MKEVNFLKLSGKNFLSIGNVPIEFYFPSGINIITGYNFDKNDENGVGKTTIVQLFYWTLFGTCLSNLKKNDILNDINNKACVGELEFEVIKNGNKTHYKIERGIKPSYCKLFIDGKEDENPSTIPILNKQIENIISSTALIFKNCIVLSMNNSIPFMAQGKPERKNFVESMFRLEVLRHMEKNARKAYNELVRKQDLNLESLNHLKDNEKTYKEKEKQFEDNKKEKIKKLEIRKQSYKDEIGILNGKLIKIDDKILSKLKSDIKKIEEDTKEKEKIKQELNSKLLFHSKEVSNFDQQLKNFDTVISEKISDFESYVSKESKVKQKLESIPDDIIKLQETNNKLNVLINNEINKLEKIKRYGDICDKCDRPFSDNEKDKNEKVIKQLKSSIDSQKNNIEKNNKEVQKLKESKNNYNSLLQLINNLKSYKDIQKKLKSVNENIHTLKESLNPLEVELNKKSQDKQELTIKFDKINKSIQTNNSTLNEINSLNKFLSSVEEDILEAKNEKNTFDVLISENKNKLAECKKSVENYSEEIEVFDSVKFVVSEEGLKSYIIKKLLDILNERIEHYLNLLESNAQLSFDEYFEDTLYNDKGIEKSYENFSGGERKRIDLACLFSFLDIRRIQGDVRFNVIFFDELLDSAISSKACDLVFNILSERFDLYNESSNIITHRKEFKSESKKLINNTIFLEKRKGFTKIGDINEFRV